MKKIIALVLMLIAVLTPSILLSGDTRVNLFPKTSSQTAGGLYIYSYDGDAIRIAVSIQDPAITDEIFGIISSVSKKKVTDWSPKMVSLPIYALETYDIKGNYIGGAWSNGFWICPDGTVYEFDYDFSELEDCFEWEWDLPVSESFWPLAAFPCSRLFCQNGDEWVKDLLTSRNAYSNPYFPEDGRSATLISQTDDALTIELKYEGNDVWFFFGFDKLTVLLDDVWYNVPPLSRNDYRMHQGHANFYTKSTTEITYDLSIFGDLPPGEYRLESQDVLVPFTVD